MFGNGHPDGFSLAPPTHHSNLNLVQEYCVVCPQVFSSPEALINHYQTHIRGEELMNFQNNFVRVQNQEAVEAQRMFGFDIPGQNQHLHPPSFSLPPTARLSTHTNNIQDQQKKPIVIPVRRIQSLPPPTNDGTIITASGAVVANQLNQPATAAISNEIDLNLEYNEENNNPVASIDDGSINLDLTLSL